MYVHVCTCLMFVLQVLIRVHACGVNPVETYIRSGAFARKPSLPYTPGSDVAGVVEAVGDAVRFLKVDRHKIEILLTLHEKNS